MKSSTLYKGEPIIDDSWTDGDVADMCRPFSRGYDPDDRPEGFAYGGVATRFSDSLLIPESEWEGLIQEQEERKSRVSDTITRFKIPHKNQQSTNFCWANGPCHAAELLRVIQGYPYMSLSPASVAAPLTNFRNQGGWGLNAVKRAKEIGWVPSSLWPDNAIERRYFTSVNLSEASKYRFREWVECKPQDKASQISMLLRQYPGSLGYLWWRHLVMGSEAVWLDGEPAVRIRNSWPGWGANGFGILRGSRMLADDIVFPISMRAASGSAPVGGRA